MSSMIKLVIFSFIIFLQSNLLYGKGLLPLNLTRHNPGNLRASIYIPEERSADTPIILILHGCTQSAESYFYNSGWASYAKEHKLFLLFPEQQTGNNPASCFNWFEKVNQQRNGGEIASIMNMIQQVKKQFSLSLSKLFVTGFSAGGALALNLMALHPEQFVSGAVIAGIPFGCAQGSTQGFLCMAGMVNNSSDDWANKIKNINPNYTGSYPSLILWQGASDYTVKKVVATEISKQWIGIHGVELSQEERELKNGYSISVWRNNLKVILKKIEIDSLGHAIPINSSNSPPPCGQSGRWEKDSPLCSTKEILRFWNFQNL